MQGHQFQNWQDVQEFLYAGNATLTIVSKKTGTRFTYRVRKPENDAPERRFYFVSLLSGPDNESDFQYMGVIDGESFRHTKASRISQDAPSWAGFAWFFDCQKRGGDLWANQLVEVWHEGKCGRCGRKLTVPESIERGIGPDCAEMMGVAA